MDDAVLRSRLEALRNNLNVVSAKLGSSAWKTDPSGRETRTELLGESSLWVGLEATLINEIKKLIRRLDDVERDVEKVPAPDKNALSNGWRRYGEILALSQGLLRECLEIVGTLAIRSRDLDDKALYVADELIRDCLTLSTGELNYFLLVHSLGDTFSQTKARIIRLRFPEWTLWDLPLAAHELGHMVNAVKVAQEKADADPQSMDFTKFQEKQRDSLLANDPELKKKHQANDSEAAEAKNWALSRVRVFLADAFATYTMGPAYACSAIMLRLSPSIRAQRDTPADAHRAQVVLSMLKAMNEKRSNLTPPYSIVIGKLEKAWDDAVERCSPASRLTKEDSDYLAGLAKDFRDLSHYQLMGTAIYPTAGNQNDGWKKAESWYEGWQEQLAGGKSLQVPETDGKLRDVLNATWVTRLMIGGDTAADNKVHKELERVGRELCAKIIDARTPGVRMRPNSAKV